MDSEHRHELKSNELANILTHFPEFCKKNSNIILGLGIIIIAVITAPMLTKMSKQKDIAKLSQVSGAIQQLDQTISQALNNSDNLMALDTILLDAQALIDETADKSDNPNLAALAYIKAAQAIRTRLHIDNQIVPVDTIDIQIQKAQQAYETAFEKAELPTIKAMAQLGLGLCAEELGQTEQAADIYQKIVDNESYSATVFPKQAQLRLDGLDENAESFNFAPAPVEAEPETTIAPETPILEEMTAEELEKVIEAKKAELEETKTLLEQSEAAEAEPSNEN